MVDFYDRRTDPKTCHHCHEPIFYYVSNKIMYHPKCFKIHVRLKNRAKREEARLKLGFMFRKPKIVKPVPPPFVPITDEEWWASDKYKQLKAKTDRTRPKT